MAYENWSDWRSEKVDFILNKEEVDYRFPLLFDPTEIISFIKDDELIKENKSFVITSIAIRYSGLFEFGVNNDNPNIIKIVLKEKYHDSLMSNLLQEVRNNLSYIKPKDISRACSFQKIDENKVYDTLTRKMTKEYLFNYVEHMVKTKKILMEKPSMNLYMLKLYYMLNKNLEMEVTDEYLIQRYYSFDKFLKEYPSISIRLHDRKL